MYLEYIFSRIGIFIHLVGDVDVQDVGDATPTSAEGIPNSKVLAQAHMARKEDRRTYDQSGRKDGIGNLRNKRGKI